MARTSKKPKQVQHLSQQSPIDLGKAEPIDVHLPQDHLVIKWKTLKDGTYDHNGGHPKIVFAVDAKVGVSLHRPGRSSPTFYPIKEFHFHSQSEHQVDGRGWPLELHIVHETKEEDPFNPDQERAIHAVLTVFFDYGEGTPAANKFFRSLTAQIDKLSDAALKRQTIEVTNPTNPKALLPADVSTFYRYEGSLTTDTQNENPETVSWVVFKQPKPLDKKVLDDYIARLAHEQKGPQPLNRRFVLLNTPAPESPGATA